MNVAVLFARKGRRLRGAVKDEAEVRYSASGMLVELAARDAFAERRAFPAGTSVCCRPSLTCDQIQVHLLRGAAIQVIVVRFSPCRCVQPHLIQILGS